MKKLVLLNSSAITSNGTYRYIPVTGKEARETFNLHRIVEKREVISAVGYEETANLMSRVLVWGVPVNRFVVNMEPGDVAIVAKVNRRIDPETKNDIPLTEDDLTWGVMMMLEGR